MKIARYLGAVALIFFSFSISAPIVNAASEFVTVKHAKAKLAGKPSCASKFPAGKGQGAAFRHQLTESCYSCPAGYKRSLNPDIKAGDACVKATAARSDWSKAKYLGKKTMAKPKGAFKDPRKGGEWWKCPDDRPRRTAYSVTDRRACATKKIVGEKLSPAEYLGKVNRSTPKGAFLDPREGGEFWSCPAGYKRTVFAVTAKNACEKVTAAKTFKAKAKTRGAWGCKKGAFKNGLENACYTCPSTYKRSAIPGTKLHKMKSACVYVKVDTAALKNPKFVRWAVKEIKKIERQVKPVVLKVASTLRDPSVVKGIRALKTAKTKKAKARAAELISRPMRAWMTANGPTKKASLGIRRATYAYFENPIFAIGPRLQVASATGLSESLTYGARMQPVPLQVAQNGKSRAHLLFPTMTVGFPIIDISLVVGASWNPFIAAWDISIGNRYKGVKLVGSADTQFYSSRSWSVGLTAGADFGFIPEFGFWTDPNTGLGSNYHRDEKSKLTGRSHGFVVAAAYKAGLGLSFWWSYAENEPRKEARFLGMTITPQLGLSAEAEYTRGETFMPGSP